jgi:prolyl-tRNA synthetase
MRFSKAFIPTLKESPAEAEIPGHKLLIRSGMLRKLSSGIYSYLPLAKRVLYKIERIVREEMDRIGGQEILMPVLHPKELWEQSGRWAVYGPELMRIRDRHNREFALGPTHEEVITYIAKQDIKSYKELPIMLYQIQTKFRDEIRPRFGVMRAREFIMKDAYSFHKDIDSLLKTYDEMHKVYKRIFEKCGLETVAVEADVGPIGGALSHEFMALAETGESEVLQCRCGYAATRENCKIAPLKNNANEEEKKLEKVYTPHKKSVEEVSDFLGVERSRLIKTIVYKADDNFVEILIRGDREINDIKVANFLRATKLKLATEEEIVKFTGSASGFVGPVGKKNIKIYADNDLKDMKNMVTGADEKDYHYINVNLERDANITGYADFILACEGDGCPKCGKPLKSSRGIELGQIFQLGDKYSSEMEACFTSETGEKVPYQMGCYGIGVTRTMAAAIEQNHDEKGIIWPYPIAPYQVELINLLPSDNDMERFSDELYKKISNMNIEILYDDRDLSPGIKFQDADLIGIPIQIIVGLKHFKQREIEFKIRKTGERIICGFEEIERSLKLIIKELTDQNRNTH